MSNDNNVEYMNKEKTLKQKIYKWAKFSWNVTMFASVKKKIYFTNWIIYTVGAYHKAY